MTEAVYIILSSVSTVVIATTAHAKSVTNRSIPVYLGLISPDLAHLILPCHVTFSSSSCIRHTTQFVEKVKLVKCNIIVY